MRPSVTLAAWILTLLLSACGGGGGGGGGTPLTTVDTTASGGGTATTVATTTTTTVPKPEAMFTDAPSTLTLELEEAPCYTIRGGVPPYTAQSDNSKLLAATKPAPSTRAGAMEGDYEFCIAPKAVGTASIVIKDAVGVSSSVIVTIPDSDVLFTDLGTALNLAVGTTNFATVYGGTTFDLDPNIPYRVNNSNPSVVRTEIQGNRLVVQALAAGTATIAISDAEGKLTTIAVTALPPTELYTDAPSTVTLAAGTSAIYQVFGGSQTGQPNPLPYQVVNSKPAVAIGHVEDGILTIEAKEYGEATILIRDPVDSTRSKKIIVSVPASGVLYSTAPANLELAREAFGEFLLFGGTAPYKVALNNKPLVASASIDGKNLTITGKQPGTTTLVVQDNLGAKLTITVTVTAPQTIALFTTAPDSLTMPQAVDATQTFAILGGTPDYTVTSSNPDVVAVDSPASGENSYTLRTKGQGAATIVIRDAEGVTIQIVATVPLRALFADAPDNLVLSATEPANTYIVTLSGGALGYSAQSAQPAVASVALIDGTTNQFRITGHTPGTTSILFKDTANASIVIAVTVPTPAALFTTAGTAMQILHGTTVFHTVHGGTKPYSVGSSGEIIDAEYDTVNERLVIKALSPGREVLAISDAVGHVITVDITVQSGLYTDAPTSFALATGAGNEYTIYNGVPRDTADPDDPKYFVNSTHPNVASATVKGSTLYIAGVAEGSATIVVSDKAGATISITVTVTPLGALTSTAPATLSLPAGTGNLYTVSGGKGPYEPSSANPLLVTASMEGSVLRIDALPGTLGGSSNVLVKDANGTTLTIAVTVTTVPLMTTAPARLAIAADTEPKVFAILGGTGKYSVVNTHPAIASAEIDEEKSLLAIKGSMPGTGSILLSDSGGATVTIEVVVNAPGPLYLSAPSCVNTGGGSGAPVCGSTVYIAPGDSDVFDIIGGIPPYVANSSNKAIGIGTIKDGNRLHVEASASATPAATAQISVTDAAGSQINLTLVAHIPPLSTTAPTSTTVAIGGTPVEFQLTGGVASSSYIVASSDPTVVKVELDPDNGNVYTLTGLKPGSAVITLRDAAGTALSVAVTVPAVDALFTNAPSSIVLAAGSPPYRANVYGGMRFGGEAPYIAGSSNPAVATATVDEEGTLLLQAHSAGTAQIAINDAKGAVVFVYVTVPDPATLYTDAPANLTLAANTENQFTIFGGTPIDGPQQYQVNNSDDSIATVSIAGSSITIAGLAAGSTQVTISDAKGKTLTLAVTVPAASALTTTAPANLTLTAGTGNSYVVSGGVAPYMPPISANKDLVTASIDNDNKVLRIDAVAGTLGGTSNVIVRDSKGASLTIAVSVPTVPLFTTAPSTLNLPRSAESLPYAIYGGTPEYTVTTSHPGVVQVERDSTTSFTLTPKSGGTASVEIKDAKGQTVTISVTVASTALFTDAPANISLAAGTDYRVAVSGGIGPYTALSSSPNIATTSTVGPDGAFTISAVATATSAVSIKVQDSTGTAITLSVTVFAPTAVFTDTPSTITLAQGATHFSHIFGGTGPYTVNNSNPAVVTTPVGALAADVSSFSIAARSAGTATIAIADAQGSVTTITVTVPAAGVVFTDAPTGLTLATDTASPSYSIGGGEPLANGNYRITSSSPSVAVPSVAEGKAFSIIGMGSGSANIIITDAQGKSATIAVTVVPPGTLMTSAPGILTLNAGSGNTYVISGGVKPYTVTSAKPALVTATLSGDDRSFLEIDALPGTAGGQSNVIVRDAQGASVTISVTVPTLDLFTTAPSTLNLPKAGTATFAILGGSPAYTVTSSDTAVVTVTQPTADSYMLTAKSGGTATIQIKDSKGATVSVSVTVASTALFVDAPPNVVVAIGADYDVTVSGGVGPYTALSSDPAIATASTVGNDGVFTVHGIAAGSAAVTVKDAAGTTFTLSLTVPAPAALFSTAPATLQILHGATNTYKVFGGTKPYVVNSNGVIAEATIAADDTLTITGKVPGHTTIAISDAKGAVISIDVTVNQGMYSDAPASLTLASGTGNTYTVFGGTQFPGADKYSVNVGDTRVVTATISGADLAITGVSVGTTNVLVRDASGTTVTIAVTVTAPGALLTTAPTDLSLSAGTGNTYVISGGVGPYTATSANTSLVTASTSGANGAFLRIDALAGTTGGQSNVIVRDAQGNSVTISVTVPTLALFTTAPASVNLSKAATATFAILGGSPNYTVTSSDDSVLVATQPDADSFLLTAKSGGTATVQIKDSKGATVTVAVTVAATTLFVDAPANIIVADGTDYDVTISGGVGPYTALSSTPAVATASAVGNDGGFTISGVDPGVTAITVKDATGATLTLSVTVPAPATLFTDTPSALTLSIGTSHFTRVFGGTGPYSVNNSNPAVVTTATGSLGAGVSAFTISAKSAGSATVAIADSLGNTLTIAVTVPTAATVFTDGPASIALAAGTSSSVFTVGGGEPFAGGNYHFSSSNPAVATPSVTEGKSFTIDALASGTANIVAIDSKGASTIIPVTVAAPSALFTTAPATLTLTMGTSSPTYSISGGVPFSTDGSYSIVSDIPDLARAIATTTTVGGITSTSFVIEALPNTNGGFTYITIRDSQGNQRTVYVTVPAPDPLFTTAPDVLNLPKAGTATFAILGGSPGYTVTSSNTAVIAVTQPDASSYTLTAKSGGYAAIQIKDSRGVMVIISVNVASTTLFFDAPPNVILAANSDYPVTISGGVGPYTATSGDPSVATASAVGNDGVFTIHGVAAGTAAMAIKDATGTSIVLSVTVPAPTTLFTTAGTAMQLLHGTTAFHTIHGGTEPYTVHSSGEIIQADYDPITRQLAIRAVSEGHEIMAISDAVGKVVTIDITVQSGMYTDAPASFSLAMGAGNEYTIYGGVPHSTTGPNEPKYNVNNTDPNVVNATIRGSTLSIGGLSQGTATLVVSDTAGATIAVTVTVVAPSALLTTAPSNLTLSAGSGNTYVISGGVGPYTATSANTGLVTASTSGTNGSLLRIDAVAGTTGGQSNVIVRDNQGASVTISVTVPTIDLFTTAPATLDLPRFGSGIYAIVGGSPIYTVTSANEAIVEVTRPDAQSFTLTAKSGGTTTVQIKDSQGKTVSISVTVAATALFVDAPTNIIVGVGADYPVTISGGVGPYTALGSDATVATTTAVDANGLFTIHGVGAGTAAITVKDATSATLTVSVTVPAPTALYSDAPATLQILQGATNYYTIYGGTKPYTVNGNSVVAKATLIDDTLSLSGLVPGHQTVAISDAKGAVITIDVTVNQGMYTDAPANLSLASGTGNTFAVFGGIPLSGANKYTVNVGDTRIATAFVTGTTLAVTGVAPGSTTVVLSDSVGATVAVNVTITAPGALSSTAPSSLTLTTGTGNNYVVSGGVAPYTVTSANEALVEATVAGAVLRIDAVAGTAGGVSNVIVRDNQGATYTIAVTAQPATLMTTAPSPLAIAAGVGARTFAVFGGTGDYTVESTYPDIVSATLAGDVLEITGSIPGTGAVLVRDSSGAIVQIDVVVNAQGPLYLSAPGCTNEGGGGSAPVCGSTISVAPGDSNTFNIIGGIPPYVANSSDLRIGYGTIVNGNQLEVTGLVTDILPPTVQISVTDAAGRQINLTLNVQASLLATTAPSNLTLAATGAAATGSYVVSGGVGPYSILSSDTSVATVSMPNPANGAFTVTGKAMGTTTLTLRDATNATITIGVTVPAPQTLFADTPSSLVLAADKTHTVRMQGGIPFASGSPYSVGTSNPAVATAAVDAQGVVTITAKSAGTALIAISDSQASTVTITVTVPAPDALYTDAPASLSLAQGTANTFTIFGGVPYETDPNYTANVSHESIVAATIAGSSLTLDALSAGNASVVLSDSQGNRITLNVTVSDSAALGTTAPNNIVLTMGESDSYSVFGGTAPYTAESGQPSLVSATMGGGDGKRLDLAAATGTNGGTANVIVTDAKGAQLALAVTVPAPTALFTTAPNTVTMPSAGGTRSFSIHGGKAGYTVTSSDTGVVSVTLAGSDYTLTSVAGGTATITIKDSQGATVSLTATVPSGPALFTDAPANITLGTASPAYTVTISGGTAPYAAQSSDPAVVTATTPAANGKFDLTAIGAGTAAVYVTDSLGATIVLSVTVPAPTALFSTAPTTMEILHGTTNFYKVYGGTAPYVVNTSGFVAKAVLDPVTHELAITGVVTGHETIAVSDANGAVITIDATVNQGMYTDAPTDLTLASGTGVSFTIFGGTPFVDPNDPNNRYYEIESTRDGVVTATITQSVLDIAGVAPGNTQLIVRDAAGVTITLSATVVAPGSLLSTAPSDLTLVAGKSEDYTVYGGTAPYHAESSQPSLVTAGINGSTLTIAAATGSTGGTTQVLLTDSVGTQRTITVTITTPPALFTTAPSSLAIASGGAARTFAVLGGTAPYSVVNTHPAIAQGVIAANTGTLDITGVSQGTAQLLISDSQGATVTVSVTVTAPGPLFTSAPLDVTLATGMFGSYSIHGGTPTYVVSSSDSAVATAELVNLTSVKITAVASGTATVTVTDLAGTVVSIDVTVPSPGTLYTTAPSTLYISRTSSPFTYAISGGYAPYSATSSEPGIVSAAVQGSMLSISAVSSTVPAGVVDVVLRDAQGQTVTITVHVGTSTMLYTTAPIVACPSNTQGAATCVITAPNSTYTYLVHGGSPFEGQLASYAATSSNESIVTGSFAGPVLTIVTGANSGFGTIQVTDAMGTKIDIPVWVGTGNSGGTAVSSYPVLSAKLQTLAGADTSAIDATNYTLLKVTLKDPFSVGIANQVVNATGDTSQVSFPDGSAALTDATGVATLKVARANLLATGAGALTVNYNYQPGMITQYSDSSAPPATGSQLSTYVGYQVTTANITLEDLTVGDTDDNPEILPAYGTSQVTVSVNINGAPATSTPVSVNFSASCGQISPATATTDNTGKVLVTYSATDPAGTSPSTLGCSGKTAQITASTSGAAAVSKNIAIQSAPATSIGFISAEPTRIYLANACGTNAACKTSSVLTYRLVNQSGEGIAGQQVVLSLKSLSPGLPKATFDTSGSTANVTLTTNADGYVTQPVYSGSVPTNVIVNAALASNLGIQTDSSVLTIASGRPAQVRMSIAAKEWAIEGFNVDGTTTTVTVSLADRQGNPVPDGTVVNFVTEGGVMIPATCTTGTTPGDSQCSVTIRSQAPRPVPLGSIPPPHTVESFDPGTLAPQTGRVTILAYVAGEEDFTDTNGNNVYDYDCVNNVKESFTDLGIAFRDDQLPSTVLTRSGYSDGEFTVPRNAEAGVCGVSGTTPTPTAGDGVWGAADIRAQIPIVFATSGANIGDLDRNGDGIVESPYVQTTSSLSFWVYDGNGNSMPTGTTVTVEAADNTPLNNMTCAMASGANVVVPNTLDPMHIGSSYSNCAVGDLIFVTVTSPLGMATSTTFPIH
ncbi:pilus assembly protein N-terminal domain-containing protein [Candidatus Symbiobacter mobilis]|uniref:BIG2 domain-containing protein n=1 Tax=Candidatus Symbiobacter mobilis CR TaxID=946483 RepID=U5N8D7_9BURK|nr:pilus assembly protein N-terminal domain-containing protein [Candidatus Symbiobacter mobilis]AGX87575.1 hypothetical protein Cenrod_1489 [Candidatus Symbiobacter mobilis CR]